MRKDSDENGKRVEGLQPSCVFEKAIQAASRSCKNLGDQRDFPNHYLVSVSEVDFKDYFGPRNSRVVSWLEKELREYVANSEGYPEDDFCFEIVADPALGVGSCEVNASFGPTLRSKCDECNDPNATRKLVGRFGEEEQLREAKAALRPAFGVTPIYDSAEIPNCITRDVSSYGSGTIPIPTTEDIPVYTPALTGYEYDSGPTPSLSGAAESAAACGELSSQAVLKLDGREIPLWDGATVGVHRDDMRENPDIILPLENPRNVSQVHGRFELKKSPAGSFWRYVNIGSNGTEIERPGGFIDILSSKGDSVSLQDGCSLSFAKSESVKFLRRGENR